MRLHTHWKEPQLLVIDGRLPDTEFYRPELWPSRGSLVEQLTNVDAISYLPDDILVKLDRDRELVLKLARRYWITASSSLPGTCRPTSNSRRTTPSLS